MTSATPGALRGASVEPVLPEDSPLAAVRQLLEPDGHPVSGWNCARSGTTGPRCTRAPSSPRSGC